MAHRYSNTRPSAKRSWHAVARSTRLNTSIAESKKPNAS